MNMLSFPSGKDPDRDDVTGWTPVSAFGVRYIEGWIQQDMPA